MAHTSKVKRASICTLVTMAALFSFAASAANASKHDDDIAFLKKLAGTWSGKGRLQRTSSSNIEPVSCRIHAAWDRDNNRLKMAYICLGLDVRFETIGLLGVKPSSGIFTGSWQTSGQNKRTSARGIRKGALLNLKLVGQHPKTGKTIHSVLVLALQARGRLANTISTIDSNSGRNFLAFAVTFKR